MLFFSKQAPDPAAVIREAAYPLTDDHDIERIIREIGDASLVLLGEASHGTHDFYELRARITRALIEERGFSAVAIEGDWPDAYQVNRYVTGGDEHADAAAALGGFQRFPTWMWRNTAVAEFIAWLRQHNAGIDDRARRTGFYGLDLYSLHASMRAVVNYLEQRDAHAATAARKSYACFEDFGEDTDQYSWAAARLGQETCEEAVARELVALQAKRAEFLRRDGAAESDEYFYAVQNARVAQNAERYYRTMMRGRVSSWNLRDEHMVETLGQLLQHLRATQQIAMPRGADAPSQSPGQRNSSVKVVVWAHNSHLGDARATEMGDSGEHNVGQLVRQKYGSAAKLIGFTTHTGSVVAASD